MVFNSSTFVVFFLLTYGLYGLFAKRHVVQNRLLLLASYVFYGWWDWRFSALMFLTTLIDYVATHKMRERSDLRGAWLGVSLLNNLGVLFILKYYEFFQVNLLTALHQFGIDVTPVFIHVMLPVGISFYTFQRMTFVLDAYREGAYGDVSFLDFALFVSFFPLLLSGPIERASRLIPQLCQAREISSRHLEEGGWLVMWGLFKKVYVADNLASLVDPVFAAGWQGSGSEVLVALYAYAFQIYCDFSGYSDVARGIAKLLGFDVMVNFKLPYFATNPSEFWRRWHISLSTWLRDYVYISLGGNRGGSWKTTRNLMLTMVLVGLWHGAAWTFIFWGFYHGVLLAAHRFWAMSYPDRPSPSRVGSIVLAFMMFHLTCAGWLLFRAFSMQQAIDRLATLFSGVDLSLLAGLMAHLLGYLIVLLLVQAIQVARQELLILDRVPLPLRGVVYGGLFYLMVLHGGTSNSFIYFQF